MLMLTKETQSIERNAENKASLDKNYNIFQTTRFNHTMIFFKVIV